MEFGGGFVIDAAAARTPDALSLKGHALASLKNKIRSGIENNEVRAAGVLTVIGG